MAGHAEPLTHATYQLARGRELDVLTGAEARALYPSLRRDLERVAAGWYCAELADRFTVERAPAAPLFDLLETALRHLDAGYAPPVICRWFDLHLLDRSGFRPELADCVSCRRALEERENAWSAAAGGALCAPCARSVGAFALSVRALKSLRYLVQHDFASAALLRIDTALAAELERHLRGFLQHVLDRDITAARLLDEIRALPPRPAVAS
jgi:DNA repair protein RecO (recombination protein O)